MKKSIFKLISFSIFPFLIVAYSIYQLGKNSDDFYKRFSSPQQNSLILGSSRAASIDPEIIQKSIYKSFPEAKIYNYAFTWAQSPYGPRYLESIQKKLIPNSKNGIFIITVEPTALMIDKDKPDDEKYYIENDKSVARTSCVSCNPNIEYLVESYDYSITQILNKRIITDKNALAETNVLDNGKVVFKGKRDIDAATRNKWKKEAMKVFAERIKGLKISQNRLNYLEKTVNILKPHGKVIIVRMPINVEPYNIENQNVPNFDLLVEKIAKTEHVQYINFNNYKNNYEWGDEVHLTPDSMNSFSKTLGDSIRVLKK